MPKDSLSSLSTAIGSSNINHLDIRITSSTGLNSPVYNLLVDGLFDTRNKVVIQELDRMVHAHLIADLRGRDRSSKVICHSVLAGGYMHLLCSTIPNQNAGERVYTTKDGYNCENECPQYGLHEHLQYLVLCRLRELVDVALEGIRVADPNNDLTLEGSNSYAAAVIMKQEVTHFRRSLGKVVPHLAGNVSPLNSVHEMPLRSTSSPPV